METKSELDAAYRAAGEAVVGHLLGFHGTGVTLNPEGAPAVDTSYGSYGRGTKGLPGGICFFRALVTCLAADVAVGFSQHGPEGYAVDAEPAQGTEGRARVEAHALWVAARIVREHWAAVEVLAACLLVTKKARSTDVATFIAQLRKTNPAPVGGVVGGTIDNVVERAEWLRYGKWVAGLQSAGA